MKIKVTELDVYPAGRIRFNYDVAELKEDIRQHGQLQPGRVIYRDEKPFVYIGVRRFLALKQLYGEIQDEKFLYYEAEVDTIESDEEIVERAVAENSGPSTGSTVRVGITPLELLVLADRYPAIAKYVPKRYMALASNPAILKLSKVQAETKYTFSYRLLLELNRIADEETMTFVANAISGMNVEERSWPVLVYKFAAEYEQEIKKRDEPESGTGLLPGTKPAGAELPESSREPVKQEETGTRPGEPRASTRQAVPQQVALLKSKQVVEIVCPHCGYRSPMAIKGSPFSVEFINKDTNEMENVDADNVLRTERMCPGCEKLMYIVVRVENVKEMKYRVSVSEDADPKVIEIPTEYPTVEYLGWTGKKWLRIGAFGRAMEEYSFE